MQWNQFYRDVVTQLSDSSGSVNSYKAHSKNCFCQQLERNDVTIAQHLTNCKAGWQLDAFRA